MDRHRQMGEKIDRVKRAAVQYVQRGQTTCQHMREKLLLPQNLKN